VSSPSRITGSYPEIAAGLAWAAGPPTLILDGELTAFGVSDRQHVLIAQAGQDGVGLSIIVNGRYGR
jgi:hypothetical protein